MRTKSEIFRISAVICSFWVAMFYFQLSAMAVVNSLTVKEEDGVATANYPMQIARPFTSVQGANKTMYKKIMINK